MKYILFCYCFLFSFSTFIFNSNPMHKRHHWFSHAMNCQNIYLLFQKICNKIWTILLFYLLFVECEYLCTNLAICLHFIFGSALTFPVAVGLLLYIHGNFLFSMISKGLFCTLLSCSWWCGGIDNDFLYLSVHLESPHILAQNDGRNRQIEQQLVRRSVQHSRCRAHGRHQHRWSTAKGAIAKTCPRRRCDRRHWQWTAAEKSNN